VIPGLIFANAEIAGTQPAFGCVEAAFANLNGEHFMITVFETRPNAADGFSTKKDSFKRSKNSRRSQ
jgi:hypothetical protein